MMREHIEREKIAVDESTIARLRELGFPKELLNAWLGKSTILDWLLTLNQQSIRTRDERGLTPIHNAVLSGNLQILNWLKTQDVLNLTLNDSHNRTPMHYAAWLGQPEVLASN